MKILITSGGSREAIDDVRYLGNRSSGRTGALISAEAVRRFHTVFLLASEGSVPPPPWAVDTGLLRQIPFSSAQDLLEKGEELLAQHRFDAIVAAAAVADYAPEPEPGKVPSNLESWTLTLHPTPKVVDRFAKLAPQALLVVFKLEAVEDEELLIARARATVERVGAHLAVANFSQGMGRQGHGALLVANSGQPEAIDDRDHLARRLVEWLEQRSSP